VHIRIFSDIDRIIPIGETVIQRRPKNKQGEPQYYEAGNNHLGSGG
jgi:hypothetical protein